MFTRLEHFSFGTTAYQTQAGLDKTTLPQGEIAIHQLVEGGFLPGILTITQSLFNQLATFFVGNLPGALAIGEDLLAEGYGHCLGKMVIHYRAVHFFEFCHGKPPCRVSGIFFGMLIS